MAANPNLRVRISADLADIKQGLAVLRGDLAKVKNEAARSAPSASGWTNGLKEARKQLAGFIAAYASLRTLGALAKVSDEATAISGRLRVATKTQEEFNAAQEETFEIAQRTRTSWQETAGLYARVSSASGSLGISQKEQLELTESVSKALALSGSYGAEAEGVMRQFGQALGNGRVQAEEFNSILDGGSRIVDALAKHFGIARDQVKKYVNDGKVSSRDLAQAMLKDRADIDASFAKMPGTIGGAFTQIRNSFVRFMGDANDATGAAASFSSVLQDVARDLPQFFEPILEVMVQLAKAMKGAEENAESLGEKTSWVAEAGQFLADVFRVLAMGAITVKNVVEILTVAITALATGAFDAAKVLINGLGSAFNALGNAWDALKSGSPMAVVKAWRTHFSGLADDMQSTQRTMLAGVQTAGQMIKADAKDIAHAWDSLIAGVNATVSKVKARTAPGTTGGDGAGTGTGTGTGKAVAQSNALLRDSVTRALAELDRLYADNEISLREYFAARTELQQQSIDLEIAQAQMSLAATKDAGQRQKLEDQIVKLQRDRADVGAKAVRDQKKAEDDLAKALGDVHMRLMELDGRTGAVERARLETEYQDLFKKLDQESDAAGRKMVENLIDRLVAKAKTDELKQAGANISNALQGKETSISAQVSGGMLGYAEGERQLADARAKALAELQVLRAAALDAMAGYAQGSPEQAAALAGLGEIDAKIAEINASQQVWKQRIEDLAVSSFGDFLGDLTTGAKSFKQAFADMVRSFVAGVAKMIAQEMALRAIKSLMGAWGGGGVGAVQRESIPVGTLHTGGMAGRASRRISVSPMLFGAAPRYHGGGIAGLKPDEVPAVLQIGERVLSRRQTAMYEATLAAGANAGRVTTPVVAIGDDAVANALAGAAGEDVVMTHVRNNWEGLQRGV
ncbi:tape measure protein [Stenotrophomonas sp. CW117]|uniref:tape measure protein n=1 Tax=Stenotrophomonas TaxID=40323 RepID=UPI001786F917|nr:tape measure protein [Stenotrophomonas sp. CW117]QOF99804.1 tape measure protein [Stenotrophomonas sp. CW117]